MSYRERLGRLPDFSMGSRFNPNALIAAGLPIAPIVEHGSWQTGEPDILRWDIRRGVGQATPPPVTPTYANPPPACSAPLQPVYDPRTQTWTCRDTNTGGRCSPGYNAVSSPPDSAGNVHQYCVRGKTAFIYDVIELAKQTPGAYADMVRHPTAGWAPARLASLGAGVLGIAGIGVWIAKGRSAPTSVKVGTPIAILASLAGAALRNGYGYTL